MERLIIILLSCGLMWVMYSTIQDNRQEAYNKGIKKGYKIAMDTVENILQQHVQLQGTLGVVTYDDTVSYYFWKDKPFAKIKNK